MNLADQIVDAVGHECKIIKHLATKITDDSLDYRPSAKQRSMLELLQYLTYCSKIGVLSEITGSGDHMEAMVEASKNIFLVNFAEAMDQQLSEIASLLKEVPDEDFINKPTGLPWGEEVRLSRALMMYGPQCLTAYRMQLFLYIKASCNNEIDQGDCWVGVSSKGDGV